LIEESRHPSAFRQSAVPDAHERTGTTGSRGTRKRLWGKWPIRGLSRLSR